MSSFCGCFSSSAHVDDAPSRRGKKAQKKKKLKSGQATNIEEEKEPPPRPITTSLNKQSTNYSVASSKQTDQPDLSREHDPSLGCDQSQGQPEEQDQFHQIVSRQFGTQSGVYDDSEQLYDQFVSYTPKLDQSSRADSRADPEPRGEEEKIEEEDMDTLKAKLEQEAEEKAIAEAAAEKERQRQDMIAEKAEHKRLEEVARQIRLAKAQEAAKQRKEEDRIQKEKEAEAQRKWLAEVVEDSKRILSRQEARASKQLDNDSVFLNTKAEEEAGQEDMLSESQDERNRRQKEQQEEKTRKEEESRIKAAEEERQRLAAEEAARRAAAEKQSLVLEEQIQRRQQMLQEQAEANNAMHSIISPRKPEIQLEFSESIGAQLAQPKKKKRLISTKYVQRKLANGDVDEFADRFSSLFGGDPAAGKQGNQLDQSKQSVISTTNRQATFKCAQQSSYRKQTMRKSGIRQSTLKQSIVQSRMSKVLATVQEYEDDEHISVEPFDYLSQQPFEIFGIVMDPLFVELTEYLQRDEEYGLIFTDLHVQHQIRSKSDDQRLPWTAEDEQRASEMGRSSTIKFTYVEKNSDVMNPNPYQKDSMAAGNPYASQSESGYTSMVAMDQQYKPMEAHPFQN